MSTAALLTPIDHIRTNKRVIPEPVPVSAVTPSLLRSIARELKRTRSKEEFTVLVARFEGHAHVLETEAEVPTIAIADGLVTATETCPLGKVLIVAAPACNETIVGTHIAAALTAGNQISVATFDPVDGLIELFCEVLTGVLPEQLFTVLSPGSGWKAQGHQSVVVVTPGMAFANDLPWWTHHNSADDEAHGSELLRFYRRSSTFHVPFRTSPYRGFTV